MAKKAGVSLGGILIFAGSLLMIASFAFYTLLVVGIAGAFVLIAFVLMPVAYLVGRTREIRLPEWSLKWRHREKGSYSQQTEDVPYFDAGFDYGYYGME